MRNLCRRGLAAALSVCLISAALAGCSRKKEQTLDTAKAMLSIADGESISAGAANLYLRYQQAEFENGVGSFVKSYYGDIWGADLAGTGEAYGNTFKEQILEDLEHMLFVKQHQSDYDIELSDEEKERITETAKAFMDANSPEVLEKMSATQETLEEMLTLYTMQQKAEEVMCADVDTEVSDEEAAQRTVSYVQFMAVVEEETESVTEGATENVSESITEVGGAAAEAVSEAILEAESDAKTNSADVEELSEGGESVAEEATAQTEDMTETEAETDTPEMAAAKADALARAEAFLAVAREADDFEAAAQEVTASDLNSYTSEYTFGDNDTYPAASIIEATKGLEDGTLVDHVVVSDTYYYVLYVKDAFDEAATEEEKERIVDERRQEMIDAVYEGWHEADEISVDGDAWTSLIFDISLTEETETEDLEALSEAITEDVSESVSEAFSEGESVVEFATE